MSDKLSIYNINNGFLGMLRDTHLRLMDVDAKNRIRNNITEDYIGEMISEYFSDEEIIEQMDLMKKQPFHVIKNYPRFSPTWNCADGIRSLMGMCHEIYKWKDHWGFQKILRECEGFEFEAPHVSYDPSGSSE
jgi:hypothetical protein